MRKLFSQRYKLLHFLAVLDKWGKYERQEPD